MTIYGVDFSNPKNVLFKDLLTVCRKMFGDPRISGSHHIFKTPWLGDPRVNIQPDGKAAKAYQVKQVIKAFRKMKGGNDGKKN